MVDASRDALKLFIWGYSEPAPIVYRCRKIDLLREIDTLLNPWVWITRTAENDRELFASLYEPKRPAVWCASLIHGDDFYWSNYQVGER